MPRLFRPEQTPTIEGRRSTIGISVSSDCHLVSAALVRASGTGWNLVADVLATATSPVPKATSSLFSTITASGSHAFSVGMVAACRAQLADLQTPLVGRLAASRELTSGKVLAVGVHDPGLWDHSEADPVSYLGLCDPARLAEATGMNVIDAFPARDIALGGQGGPVTAAAEWVLLRSQLRNRVLIDLGRTIRISFLPAASSDRPAQKLLAYEIGPGMALLDLLAQRLTSGQQQFDPGGHLAVQGQRIPELIADWARDPYFNVPPPRWHPRGVRPERFLTQALQKAVAAKWSIRDILCTATHFIAEMIADTLHRRIHTGLPIDEVIVTGGGQQNGMLLRELVRATNIPIIRLSDLQLPPGALEPATIAILAMFYLDQMPATQTAISKTGTPRFLGRLTPGSSQNWQYLLRSCADQSPALMPLRNVI